MFAKHCVLSEGKGFAKHPVGLEYITINIFPYTPM
jgi:hypothetical protein